MIVCFICCSDASRGYMVGNGMAGCTFHYCSKECMEAVE